MKIATLSAVASIIVIGAISGFTGAKVEETHTGREYPIITIGCYKPDHYDQCREQDMVKVLTKAKDAKCGWIYRFSVTTAAMGYQEFTARFSDDYTPPWDAGDVAIYIRYQDRADQGCWSIKPEGTGTLLRRDENNLTDSEAAASKGD